MIAPFVVLLLSALDGYLVEDILLDVASLVVFGGVGGLVIFRRDGNAVGWLLSATGVTAISTSRIGGIDGIPAALRDWIGNLGWPLVFALFTWLALVFPGGHLPEGTSRFERYQRAAGKWWLPLLLVALAVASWQTGPSTTVDTETIDSLLWVVPWALVMATFVASAISLVLRRRRASGVERAQLGWVVLPLAFLAIAVLVTATAVLGTLALGGSDPGDGIWIVVYVAILVFPLTFGIAVLRYKLYEIDRIISRTVSYGLVSAVLVGVYLVAVFVMRTVLPLEGELAVAASTLLVAGLFTPLRRRIQAVVDRRFNRPRFDAERTMEALSRRLSSEVDLAELGRELSQVASQTMQPANVTIWLRDGAGTR
jgi:hypothetical protein